MKTVDYFLIAAVALGAFGLYSYSVEDKPTPAPVKQPTPAPDNPCPSDKCPKPKPKPQPWEAKDSAGRQTLGAKVAGPKLEDGTELACDYPGERHRRNTSSKGLGLCVFTSIHHAADWLDIPALLEMPKWMISSGIAGGGYPQKVTQLIQRLCQERGMPVPDYFQVENADYEILKLACASGRMVCTTYSKSPTGRYNGSHIAHMVNVVHADDKWVVVLDNNYTGYNAFEWMTPAEFKAAGGLEWIVVFLNPPPPLPPHNGDTPAPKPQPVPMDGQLRPMIGSGQCGKQECKCGCEDGDPCRCAAEELKLKAARLAAKTLASCAKSGKVVKVCPCSPQCTCGCNRGEPCWCNGPPPEVPQAPEQPDWRTHGVTRERIADEPRYRHGEFQVSRDDIILTLEKVPADANKMRATFIGSKEQRAIVEKDWKTDPGISQVKDGYVFKSYDPEHWHVKGFGFAPGLTITAPDGKELYYAKEYPGAAETSSTLRRLRPDYTPGGGGLISPSKNFPVKTAAAIGVAALAGFVVLRRRQS